MRDILCLSIKNMELILGTYIFPLSMKNATFRYKFSKSQDIPFQRYTFIVISFDRLPFLYRISMTLKIM